MDIDYIALGKHIRKYRKQLGFTQEKLAELSELNTNYVCQIELGNTKLALPSLVKISNALKVTIDQLLSDSLCHYEDSEIYEMYNTSSEYEKELIKNLIIAVRKTRSY